MLAQRISKVSKVHQSILKTNRFLIYWLTEIQSDSLLYGCENAWFPSTHGFEVKRLLHLKTYVKKRWGEVKKIEIVLIRVHLAYSGAKVPSCFYLRDLVTHTGDQEIHSVSGRLPEYPGELACMLSFKGQATNPSTEN